MKVCSVPNCGKPHIARSYCQNHYRVFRRMGTPTPARPEPMVHEATGGYLFRTVNGATRYLHVDAAERAIGRQLPIGAEVHHLDGNPKNNANTNLVVCPNHEYHMVIHQRERAFDACGNPSHRPCKICGKYDDPSVMRPQGRQFYHSECCAAQSRAYRASRNSVGAQA